MAGFDGICGEVLMEYGEVWIRGLCRKQRQEYSCRIQPQNTAAEDVRVFKAMLGLGLLRSEGHWTSVGVIESVVLVYVVVMWL